MSTDHVIIKHVVFLLRTYGVLAKRGYIVQCTYVEFPGTDPYPLGSPGSRQPNEMFRTNVAHKQGSSNLTKNKTMYR